MDDCIFCKIVRGELPSFKVYEDEHTLAFLDIHPVHQGHTLIIPKDHAGNIFEISSETWAHVQETVRKVAHAVEKGTNADGVNMLMNNRQHAGQAVHHAHVHLIPRFKGDGLHVWPHKPLNMQEGPSLASKIQQAV
jgi:histidine triad (HIT) family protein